MKKILIAIAAFGFFAQAGAQQLNVPAASTTQNISQTFALGKIDLSYSRPSAKGRTIMGDLVPYGKVWRTGANLATTIAFSEDVAVGGKPVKAGKYGLLSIPGEKEWTIIITKDLNVTSPAAYNAANDVARVMVPVRALNNKMETFTMQFHNITNNSCDLSMAWENTLLWVPITMDVDGKVMSQIDQAMNKDNKPYYAAAQYYYENDKDLKQAKMWADKAVAANPNAFWMTMLSARISAKMGDKAGATAMADKTIDLATKAKNDDYVKMANDLKASL